MFGDISFKSLPIVVKNLLIINGLIFLSTYTFPEIKTFLALHPIQSENFLPHQIITHMFMHGNFSHLFFNMFGLWIFGKLLEKIWGPKKFLTYYMATGLGAVLIYSIIHQIEISIIESGLTSMEIARVNSVKLIPGGYYGTPLSVIEEKLFLFYNTPVVGASGAIYGLLLAFGYLFPNSVIYLYLAIPIKAKYFVLGLGLISLFSGIMPNPSDNVAHFAHLGGMIFGFILLKYWKQDRNNFY
ncbi:MAG: rhomboid family intramembrane serine protease [Flavobacteriales bacterium]|nr:rhomboid family intramembrane serine protease [Flavobacteriales bacterium]